VAKSLYVTHDVDKNQCVMCEKQLKDKKNYTPLLFYLSQGSLVRIKADSVIRRSSELRHT